LSTFPQVQGKGWSLYATGLSLVEILLCTPETAELLHTQVRVIFQHLLIDYEEL
jgi:hypothetical protein